MFCTKNHKHKHNNEDPESFRAEIQYKQTSSSIHLYRVCLIIAVKSGVFSCFLKVVLVTVDRMEVKEGYSVLYHDRTSRRRSFTGST